MVSRALMSTSTNDTNGRTTYGELLWLARNRAREAGRIGSGPFATADEAAGAVAGFERYFAVVGQHLRIIAAPGLAPAHRQMDSLPVLQQLIQRMSNLRLTPAFETPWGRAADTLATAHDLLATHVGPYGERRTPEIEVLADSDHRQATARVVLELLDEPLAVRDNLLKAATGAQRGAAMVPSSRAVTAHIRQSTDAIAQLSTRYTANTDTSHVNLSEVAALEPAVPPGPSGSRGFDDSLQALRALRLISYQQSNGVEQASPGSLHDLIRLARTTTARPTEWLPAARTPIERVQRANAIDQLETAGAAWRDTSVALGQHIRGLTKAPRAYAEAIGLVQQSHVHEGVRRAVLAALPRLGREAGLTTSRLAWTGSLTIATKEVGRFQESWRLLVPEESKVLGARFERAGHASQTASIAVTQLDRATNYRASSLESTAVPHRDRSRALGGRLR